MQKTVVGACVLALMSGAPAIAETWTPLGQTPREVTICLDTDNIVTEAGETRFLTRLCTPEQPTRDPFVIAYAVRCTSDMSGAFSIATRQENGTWTEAADISAESFSAQAARRACAIVAAR